MNKKIQIGYNLMNRRYYLAVNFNNQRFVYCKSGFNNIHTDPEDIIWFKSENEARNNINKALKVLNE